MDKQGPSNGQSSATTDALYPMRLVARMTGLAPATIRAWERRYQAVEPRRTDGNTRMFSASDVRRLTLLKEVTSRGHSIGAAATLDDAALEAVLVESDDQAVERASRRHEGGASQAEFDDVEARIVSSYLDAVARFDARQAQSILVRSAALLPVRTFVTKVVAPVVQAVGERWSHAEIGIAQEHMVTAQLKGTLASLLHISPPDRGARKVVLATPSGHAHEFGVLIGALLAAGRGMETVYLGPDLPVRELAWAADVCGADAVLLGVVADLDQAGRDELPEALRRVARRHSLWVGCPKGHELQRQLPEARYFHDYETLDLALLHLSQTAKG